MDDDPVVPLQFGDEPSERTTNAFIACIRGEHPELWARLKRRELDVETREEEFYADPDAFRTTDDEAMSEIYGILAERFPLNSAQLLANISRLRDAALDEAEAEMSQGTKS